MTEHDPETLGCVAQVLPVASNVFMGLFYENIKKSPECVVLVLALVL